MIKSFEIDHTKLKAPTIRLADVYTKDGVEIRKYDIRLVKPNTTYIDDKTMHSMEHLMATAFKEVFKDDMIDLSPMGCKTGFYFTEFANENDIEKIKASIKYSAMTLIPTPTRKNCGSYLLHNIEGARVFLERIYEEINSSSDR